MDKLNELASSLTTMPTMPAMPKSSKDFHPQGKNTIAATRQQQIINNSAPDNFQKYQVTKSRSSLSNFDRVQLHAPRANIQLKNPPTDAQLAPSGKALPASSAESFLETIALQIVDVLNGHRPARQLQTWLSTETYEILLRRHNLGMRIHGGPQKCTAPYIKRSRIFNPCDGVAEAGIVIFDGLKTRAAALRAEAIRAKWRITAIEIA